MVAIAAAFGSFKKRRALVAGDLLLDSYTIGKTERISPEAPVPVVHVSHQEARPGGAGNVMLNLRSLDVDVVAIGHDNTVPEPKFFSKNGVDQVVIGVARLTKHGVVCSHGALAASMRKGPP